jgi:hypothetical protein
MGRTAGTAIDATRPAGKSQGRKIMQRLSLLSLLVVAVVAMAARPASAAASFALPSTVAITAGTSGSFLVSVSTDTAYKVYGFTVDLALTPNSGGNGLSFTGLADDNSASYLLHGNSDTISTMGSNSATQQGGASTCSASPYYTNEAAGTYTMVKVSLVAAPTAAGSYTVSFVQESDFNELTVDAGGPADLPAAMAATSTITIVPAPEPASLLLLATGAGLLALRRRRRGA